MTRFSSLRKPKESKHNPSVPETPKSEPTRSMSSSPESQRSKPIRSMTKLADVLKRNNSSTTLERLQNDSTHTLASSPGSKIPKLSSAKQLFTSRRPSVKSRRTSSPGSSSDNITLASDGRPSVQVKRDSDDSVYAKRVSMAESFQFVHANDIPVASSPIEVTADIHTATVNLNIPSEDSRQQDSIISSIPVVLDGSADDAVIQDDSRVPAFIVPSDFQLPSISPGSSTLSLPQSSISPLELSVTPALVTSVPTTLEVPDRIPQPLSPILESVAATPVVESAGPFSRDSAFQPSVTKGNLSSNNLFPPTDSASSTLPTFHDSRQAEVEEAPQDDVNDIVMDLDDQKVTPSTVPLPEQVHEEVTISLPVSGSTTIPESILSDEPVAQPSTRPELESSTSQAPPTRDDRQLPNVIFFGDTGVGKSSVINMLMGNDVVRISNAADGMTFNSQSYVANIEGVRLSLWDTPGLSEIEGGTTHARVATRNIRDLVGAMQEGVSLLVYCVRAGRFRPHLKANYDLIVESICQAKVPVIIVITGLENQVPRSSWWTQNDKEFYDHGMKFDGYSCVTATRGKPSRVGGFLYDKEYNESQGEIRKLVKDFFAQPRLSWTIENKEAWATQTSLKMDSYYEVKHDGMKKIITSDLPSRQYIAPPQMRSFGSLNEQTLSSIERSKSWSEWLGSFWYGSNSCS